jgi:hypothetical protein
MSPLKLLWRLIHETDHTNLYFFFSVELVVIERVGGNMMILLSSLCGLSQLFNKLAMSERGRDRDKSSSL